MNNELKNYAASLRASFEPSKRLLLVQGPQFLFESINLDVIRDRAYYAFPPTGLQWIAQSLRSKGCEIEYLDLNFELLKRVVEDPSYDYKRWLEMLDEKLEEFEPSIVGVTCLTVYADLFNTYHPLTAILRHLREKQKYIVMAGGATVVNEIEGYLNRDLCHFIIDGEGEEKVRYLFDILLDGDSSEKAVEGIHFKTEGAFHRTQGDIDPVSLSGTIVDEYQYIPVEEYCKVGSLNPFSRMAGMDTIYGVFHLIRGCRCNCKFCGVRAFMGKGTRSYPPEDVLTEMRYLASERGVRHFELLDDDFLTDSRMVKELLSGMSELRREFGTSWSASNGMIANSLTHEILALMRDSGCLGLKIGIESGNPRMLRKMRKPGSVKSFLEASERIQAYPEIFVGGNYIVGLFGEETWEEMADSFAFANRMNLDWSTYSVFQFTSTPNTVAENLKSDGGSATDFTPAKDLASRDIPDDRSLPMGIELFSLPPGEVPSRTLIKNVWLTFNLVGNYFNNKNLLPGGRPEKFVSWMEAVEISYPTNPYMRLFGALGNVLLGREERARAQFSRATELVECSENWTYRFEKFGLTPSLLQPPETREQVYELLDHIRAPFNSYLG